MTDREHNPSHGEPVEDPRARDAQTLLTAKLQTAFAGMHAGEELAARIRSAVSVKQHSTPPAVASKPAVLPFPFWKRGLVPAGAAAAAALVVVLAWLVQSPRVSFASPIEAIEWMHLKEIEPCRRFTPETDPQRLRTFLTNKLGTASPVVPQPQGDLRYIGGCVRALWSKPAASYLLETDKSRASVVLFARKPETLGMTGKTSRKGHTVYTATHGEHNLAAVRLGDWTYTVVGAIGPETALSLLDRVIAAHDSH